METGEKGMGIGVVIELFFHLDCSGRYTNLHEKICIHLNTRTHTYTHPSTSKTNWGKSEQYQYYSCDIVL